MPEQFNARKVSPSRIGTYADCGEKFRLKYIERRQPESLSSALLFGSVMHAAREIWVVDRSQVFVDLVREAWHTVTKDEPMVAAFLNDYARLSRSADAQIEAIKADWEAQGKESKNPKATKAWKESPIAIAIAEMVAEWLPKLEESKYTFTANDPLPALFNESLRLAESYQARWGGEPNAYVSELPFDFEWNGFRLTGYIDDISPLLDRDTGELLGHAIVDAKTYKMDVHAFKDWRQCAIYKLAYRHLVSNRMLPFEPSPKLYVCIDRMRLLDRLIFDLEERDELRLLRELQMYERAVEHEIFIPASKTCFADRCEFAGICAYYHGKAALPVRLNVA